MRLPLCLLAAALALGGCTQTGQMAMQSGDAPDGADASVIGQTTDAEKTSTAPSGLASFFAPAQRVQMAEAINIPGDFKAPENPPVPPSRPDFGDRVQVAASPNSLPAPEPAARPAAAEVTGSVPTVTNLPPQTTKRAEAASLGAYEFKTAGVPMPDGGLRATSIAYAPAQFELAGASAAPNISRPGGARWRAAYDDVRTDCFPETLRKALDQIAAHFNSEVLVTSGKRDRGRRGSLHRSCKAADIRVVGVSPGEVARVARDIPGINGVGTYRRVALTHVDVRAERFAWRW